MLNSSILNSSMLKIILAGLAHLPHYVELEYPQLEYLENASSWPTPSTSLCWTRVSWTRVSWTRVSWTRVPWTRVSWKRFQLGYPICPIMLENTVPPTNTQHYKKHPPLQAMHLSILTRFRVCMQTCVNVRARLPSLHVLLVRCLGKNASC